MTTIKSDNDKRIYGGMNTEGNIWDVIVAIFENRTKNHWDFYCGGSILDSCHVLTAAHCAYVLYIFYFL